MGSRALPIKCSHGAIIDWGDFGPGEPEPCAACNPPEELHELDDIAKEFGVDLRPTLTEFLLARIAEDETYAPKYHDSMCEWAARGDRGAVEADCDCGLAARREFHLAECEAKRRIVTLMGYVRESWENKHAGEGRVMWDDITRREKSHAFTILAELASVYADHPDYCEEWKP